MLIYLKDTEEGGETIFPQGTKPANFDHAAGARHSVPGYLTWRSARLEFESLSKQTVRFAIQWYNMAIRPSISQESATAI